MHTRLRKECSYCAVLSMPALIIRLQLPARRFWRKSVHAFERPRAFIPDCSTFMARSACPFTVYVTRASDLTERLKKPSAIRGRVSLTVTSDSTRACHPAKRIKHLAQLEPVLRCVFIHQRQVRGGTAPCFVRYIRRAWLVFCHPARLPGLD